LFLYHQLKSRLPELFPESGSALKRRTKVFLTLSAEIFLFKKKNLGIPAASPPTPTTQI